MEADDADKMQHENASAALHYDYQPAHEVVADPDLEGVYGMRDARQPVLSDLVPKKVVTTVIPQRIEKIGDSPSSAFVTPSRYLAHMVSVIGLISHQGALGYIYASWHRTVGKHRKPNNKASVLRPESSISPPFQPVTLEECLVLSLTILTRRPSKDQRL